MKRACVLSVVIALFVCGFGVGADAAPLGCGGHVPDGATIKLSHDIVNCAADPAVQFDGDNSVLDLNGHTISGQNVGDGIDAVGKDHDTVKNGKLKGFITSVRFSSNGNRDTVRRVIFVSPALGVDLFTSSHGLVIGSTFSHCGTECVLVEAADNSTIVSNKMSTSQDGVHIDGASTNTLVSGDRITGGTAGVDITTTGPAFTRVTHNVIRGASSGVDVSASAVNTSVTSNNIAGSFDGIHVASGALTTAVGSNTSNANTHDGIFVQSSDAGSSVGDNTANNNGNYGVEATAATDDAGGDRAKGNGQFFQCIFVVCT